MVPKWEHILATTTDWWLQHGSRIVVTLIAIWVAMRGLRVLVALMNKQIVERPEAIHGNLKQARTVTAIVEHTGTGLIVFLGVLLIAAELGFNPAAILASAGFIGVALGLGAQSLVKDLVAGAFILFEDQFGVGDVIRTGTHVGEVEMMSLRTTCLRDEEGAYVIIPNGDLGRVTNYAKHWGKAIVDVDLAGGEDIDQGLALLTTVAFELAAAWPERILDKPQIQGVEKFVDSGVTLRVVIKTQPLKQWEVARELRKRVKEALVANGIAQPVPRRQIRIDGEPVTVSAGRQP